MKKPFFQSVVLCLFILFTTNISCKKTENPIKYPLGTFPDSAINLAGINSEYDDFNSDIYQLYGEIYLIFSTNRGSSGGQFDFEQAQISFIFDQTTGEFQYNNSITNIPFIERLINTANSDANDLGPYSLFSTVDGYEYLLKASENTEGNLDFYFYRNLPAYGSNLPVVEGPFIASLLNTSADDAYISFDLNQDTAYFSSSVDGNFDIYLKTIPADKPLLAWLNGSYTPSSRVDSVNSSYDDKCPLIYRKIMLFASNRPGGLGGYDLYYSIFRNGNWSSPVNFGPDVNTSADEFRPRLWIHGDFTNDLMLFSSNREGGKGGFDLYFLGVSFPKE